MDGGRRSNLQPPFVSDYPPARDNLPPPLTTDEASEKVEGIQPEVGDTWVADEMAVKVGSWQMWNWNVMDEKTRYILASHLSRHRTQKAASETLEKAKAAAGREPKSIKSDKLRSYSPAIKKVFPGTKHIQSDGIRAEVNNNLSERLQGTFRSRTKTLRGLDSVETGQRYLDGWVITYNHMRGHESLKNQTPGKKANAEPAFDEWADVVKGDAMSPQLVSAKTRLADAPQLRPDATPTPKTGKQSRRSETPSVSRKPRPAKHKAVARPTKATKKVKSRSAKQHPAYKLRQKERRKHRGGR